MNRFIVTAAAIAALSLAACAAEEEADNATGPEIEESAAPEEEAAEVEIDRSLDAILASDVRSDDDRARDAYRHPKATLEFFGLEPTMNVVEIWPSRGYYMDIVAPYVAGQGVYVYVGFDRNAEAEYVQRIYAAVDEKLAANADYYGEIVETTMTQESFDIAPEGSADMVLTFRNVHSWMRGGYAPQVFDAMFKALKPGGVLGLVAHRGNPDVDQDPKAENGYVNQDVVIEMAEAAGFQLADSSEVNANALDTKDYPQGVWTLPPSFRLGDEDKEKYSAIGESDRMTLKFVKPATTGMAAR
jgi:predicted methyltransferase